MISESDKQKAEAQSLLNETSLTIFIRRAGLNEVKALNALTEAGLISDLCVNAADVASCDCFAACLFLQNTLDTLK